MIILWFVSIILGTLNVQYHIFIRDLLEGMSKSCWTESNICFFLLLVVAVHFVVVLSKFIMGPVFSSLLEALLKLMF
jgi:hypothetical protein